VAIMGVEFWVVAKKWRQLYHLTMRLYSEFIKKEEEGYEGVEKVLDRNPALARDPDFMKKHENRKRVIDIKKNELAQWEEELRKLDD
jgi:hypothetical protein